MRTSAKLASLLVLFTSFAFAQTFDGKWSGPATSPSAGDIQVDLTITKSGGVMRYEQKVNYTSIDQCANRDITVSVVSQTATEMVIAIQGAKVLKGCFDETATLKIVDGKTLQSTLKDGRTMKLSRK